MSAFASAAKPQPLIAPTAVGAITLQHKVVHSPMTRTRMSAGSELPNDHVKIYYEQRATPGGLLITECAYVSPSGRGYVRAPGMATAEQAQAWRGVVDAVHAKGGYIYAQLFHAGRVSHASLAGGQLVSASALGMSGQLYVEGGVKEAYSAPRALETAEVAAVAKDFARAAALAVKEGGFDGIELHAGNGYLLQQFLAQATNQRADKYGGSVANRARLLLEAVDACVAEVGADKVSIKLQPGVTFSELVEPEDDVLAQLDYLGPELAARKLSYVCLSSLNGEPYYKFVGLQEPNAKADLFRHFRQGFGGTLMINGGLAIEVASQYAADGTADLVAFGTPFIANANLPQLVAAGYGHGQLNPGGYNTAVWYSKDPSKDAENYIDWPLVAPQQQ